MNWFKKKKEVDEEHKMEYDILKTISKYYPTPYWEIEIIYETLKSFDDTIYVIEKCIMQHEEPLSYANWYAVYGNKKRT